MAEKTEKKPDAAPPAAPVSAPKKDSAKGGGLMTKTPILLGAVMVLEAVVLFAGFKFLGSTPKVVVAGPNLTTSEEDSSHSAKGEGEGEGKGKSEVIDKKKSLEVKVIEFKAPNKLSGRSFIYDVSIYAITKGEHADKVKQTLQDSEARITDRIRTIIAQSDPEKLGGGSEPGLETLRRQVKYQLDEIIGEGMLDEILIKRCIPYRTDY